MPKLIIKSLHLSDSALENINCACIYYLSKNVDWVCLDKSKFLRAATYLDWRYKNFEYKGKDNKVKKCPRDENLNKARHYLEDNSLKALARQVINGFY